jgi:hypothetical protein
MTDLQATEAAVEWFERSGIQESTGGVARYHLLAEDRNLPVSTEITGYAVSALTWAGALASARRAADYLVDVAWMPSIAAMPFEIGGPSYFFDCGVIARGLLAFHRRTGEAKYLDAAREIGLAMGRDFWSDSGEIHPILSLPSKEPWPYEKRWSREPGCFQLKSALAWSDLGFDDWYERALAFSLRTHDSFLPGESDPIRVMDRLHAYCYFLEALCKHRTRTEDVLRSGIGRVAGLLREIGPRFERSDVCGQLLRVRLMASDVIDLDIEAASYEAAHCASHQRFGGALIEDGGFGFGTREGVALPYMNTVSTAFCMQACAWWSDWRNGVFRGTTAELI